MNTTPDGTTKVAVGNRAPDFTLPSQNGTTVQLADFIGKSPLIVYFYPKDNTPGCTTEACTFRDSYEAFKDAGAEVIGISSDDVKSHERFAASYQLPFVLLSDEGGKVRKLYNVPTTLGLLPGRVTYIIDKHGIIRHIFSSQFNPKKHVDEALRVVRLLKQQ